MQIIAIDDLLKFILRIIDKDLKGTFVLANEEKLTYREVFGLIAKVYERRLYYIALPIWLLKALINFGDMVKNTSAGKQRKRSQS